MMDTQQTLDATIADIREAMRLANRQQRGVLIHALRECQQAQTPLEIHSALVGACQLFREIGDNTEAQRFAEIAGFAIKRDADGLSAYSAELKQHRLDGLLASDDPGYFEALLRLSRLVVARGYVSATVRLYEATGETR